MCKCLKDFDDALKKEYGETAKIDTVMLFCFNCETKIYPKFTFSYMTTYRKKKKEISQVVIPNFCPWCGKEYE